MAPHKMAENLSRNWHTTNSAELSIYRERKTGNERTVVTEDFESRMSTISGNIFYLISVGASAFGAITQVESKLTGGSEATGWIVTDDGSSSANNDPDLPSPDSVD